MLYKFPVEHVTPETATTFQVTTAHLPSQLQRFRFPSNLLAVRRGSSAEKVGHHVPDSVRARRCSAREADREWRQHRRPQPVTLRPIDAERVGRGREPFEEGLVERLKAEVPDGKEAAEARKEAEAVLHACRGRWGRGLLSVRDCSACVGKRHL